MSRADAAKAEAIERLKGEPFNLKPGDRIGCILRHVSRSGMYRQISLVKMFDGDALYLDGLVARALGINLRHGRQGIPISGVGMDMGFALVYDLSRALFPKPTCIGERCPSNDHSNGDGDYTIGKPHSDGGYFLTHVWL